jgi:DNA-binding MarR family transcriptional regulator/GNAT superfamily N-acetyltransferase
MTAGLDVARRVEAVRRFSRFYTRRIGVLHEGLLGSQLSLAQGRVLWELAQRGTTNAAELAGELGLDPGYLSRILRGFEERGLIAKEPSPADGRQSLLVLAEAGRDAFAAIDARSRDEIGALLEPLSATDQRRLVEAMGAVEELLGDRPRSRVPYVLRPHQPGDMGWVVHRHGVLYAAEYGWDERFEALVAAITAEFIQHHDPRRERCWMAEMEGEVVGSVFLVRQSDEVAKLRLLLVEPRARGQGIGARLVEECVRFATRAGYRRLTLWTNSILVPARRLYERAGFRLTQEEPHHSFGHDLTGETWELDLRADAVGLPPR